MRLEVGAQAWLRAASGQASTPLAAGPEGSEKFLVLTVAGAVLSCCSSPLAPAAPAAPLAITARLLGYETACIALRILTAWVMAAHLSREKKNNSHKQILAHLPGLLTSSDTVWMEDERSIFLYPRGVTL